MSDEEKQAIKDCDNIFICLDDCMSEDSANDYRKSYKILKNLIEKQQKEIEELKNADLTTVYFNGFYDGEKKVKDKIKAKIEEYENKIKKIRSKKLINEPEDTIVITRYTHYISVLQSLLEKE